MKSKIVSLLSAAVLVLALGSMAKADSLNFGNGLSVTGTLTTGGSNFTLTFTITNSNSADAGIDDFSLQLTGGNGSVNITSESGSGTSGAGWNFFDDTKQNNGSGNTCNTTTNSGWVCTDYSGGFDTIAGNGGSLTWTYSGTFTGTPVSVLELMAQGCTAVSGQTCPYNGAGSYNISAPMDGDPVPEPGSLALFGTGTLAIAGFLRRKLFA